MKLIDKIRLNQFALLGVFGVAGISEEIYKIAKTQSFDYWDAGRVAVAAGLLAYTTSRGIRFAREQNRCYNLLRKKINLHGIDDELVSKFTDYACGRRALRAALKETGNIGAYSQLKKENPVSAFDYIRNSLGFRKLRVKTGNFSNQIGDLKVKTYLKGGNKGNGKCKSILH